MLPNHVHGPNCGCREYQSFEDGEDLLGVIEVDKIHCLNETVHDSGKKVFKPQEDKLKEEGFVLSDVDPELIFIIPFTQQVKIKSINIRAKSNDLSPTICKIYKNEENVDFTIQEQEPVQEIKLGPNLNANVECALKIMKLQNVYKLVLYINGEGKDQLGITYIGLKGIRTNLKKEQVVLTNYESKPNVKDHKVFNESEAMHQIGQ